MPVVITSSGAIIIFVRGASSPWYACMTALTRWRKKKVKNVGSTRGIIEFEAHRWGHMSVSIQNLCSHLFMPSELGRVLGRTGSHVVCGDGGGKTNLTRRLTFDSHHDLSIYSNTNDHYPPGYIYMTHIARS